MKFKCRGHSLFRTFSSWIIIYVAYSLLCWYQKTSIHRLRHQQAKDVVFGLRESLEEKDTVIQELRYQLGGQQKRKSETDLKRTVTTERANTVIIFPLL